MKQMIITDELLNRSMSVEKIDGYNLYYYADELGNHFLVTLKPFDLFGKTLTITDSVGRSFGDMTKSEFLAGIGIGMFENYKEN